ncbi:MAG: hypothetical protein WC350_02465 [Candidatus Micrarchaeia archaeon]|jgi:hypothetical protein
MMDNEEGFRAVCKQLFGAGVSISLEEGAKLFSYGIELPRQRKTMEGGTTHTNYGGGNYVNPKEVQKLTEGGNMFPVEKIDGMEDVQRLYSDLRSFLGDKSIDAQNMEKSDNVLASSDVYMSDNIVECKNVGFSFSLFRCEYVYGSKNLDSCSFSIRCQDSRLLNNCFEVSWSAKCTDSMFCHDSFDLRDCLFCFHLASKQYCIANRQYSREDYLRIKGMLLEHLKKNGFRADFFPQL